MKRLILKLDSHQLTEYQTCQQLFKYSAVDNLEAQEPGDLTILSKIGAKIELPFVGRKQGMMLGTLLHECLALFNRLRRRGFSSEKAMWQSARRIERYSKKYSIKNEALLLFKTKYLEYISFYTSQDVYSHPLGIEIGFSETIFEDKAYKFIYEGKIDLIYLLNEPNGLPEIKGQDYKTRTQNYKINPFNNQMIGYAWALYNKFDKFRGNVGYNYFGMQKGLKPPEAFVREPIHISRDLVKSWKEDTIYWYHRIAQSIIWSKYPKSRSACQTKYGMCDYFALCSAVEPKLYIDKHNREFKTKSRIWQAWE